MSVVSGQFQGKFPEQDEEPKSKTYQLRTADDMTIFVEERGDVSNPTIIFTHGYFTSRLAWETTFTSNRLNRYHLVRWDLRGMGDSSKDTDLDKYNNLDLYANDVKLIVDDVLLKKGNAQNNQIFLVTWGTGSIATLSYFRNFTTAGVSGYVSVANNFQSFKVDNIFTEYSRVTIGGVVTSETYMLILDSLKNLFNRFTSTTNPLLPPTLSFFIGIGAYAPTESRLAYGQLDYNFTETFTNLKIPTLSIYGDDDQIVNPVHSRSVAALRPNDVTHEYQGVGHAPMWEVPERFENDLDNWIDDE
ncbi:11498_t:CDS:2 [Funneliformis caledonium]|uniref:11498_t:CDS:1 n=1 Tax=Funneliformis caledonium TaxID=1117310 RepID=A0A9N8VS77_9GLOM|nr:11498_t:CDS:2 [Funneliformis caledonium]